jgi:hypothetical protein
VFPIVLDGTTYSVYIGVLAGGLNLVVAFIASALFKSIGVAAGKDVTSPADFELPKA